MINCVLKSFFLKIILNLELILKIFIKENISNSFHNLNMEFYCDICDKSMKHKSKHEHFKSGLRNHYEKCFRKKHVNTNPDFFDRDKLFNIYITHHNKNIDLHLINCEFKSEFDNQKTSHIKTMYTYNTHIFNMKIHLLHFIAYFISQGYKFWDINQIIIKTISHRCNMTYKHYLKQPMSMCERKLNMIIAKNPTLLNSLKRYHNHPLIGE